jgi:tetratricopeptide (TPR) repeat protein
LERAVELLEQATPYGTDFTPQKIEEFSLCFLNLAELYEESGMSGKALRLYKLALDVNIEAAGETGSLRVYDPALLYTLHLISRGDFTEAEAVWKKAIAAMRQFAVTTSDTDLGSTIDQFEKDLLNDTYVPKLNKSNDLSQYTTGFFASPTTTFSQ